MGANRLAIATSRVPLFALERCGGVQAPHRRARNRRITVTLIYPSFPRRRHLTLCVTPVGRPGEGHEFDCDVRFGGLKTYLLKRFILRIKRLLELGSFLL